MECIIIFFKVMISTAILTFTILMLGWITIESIKYFYRKLKRY